MADDNDDFVGALKSRATRHRAPTALRARIAADIANLGRTTTDAVRVHRLPDWLTWRGIGAGFALGAVCAVVATSLFFRVGNEDRIADEMVAGHVRALMTGRLTEVLSSDSHTVKPWFAGKLAFSPPVWNGLPNQFPLVGARVDYLDNRAVAALVYKNREHLINVFVSPAANADSAMRRTGRARSGYQWLAWTDAGMQFWAVSDVSIEELERFRDLSLATSALRKGTP